ncbi:hypothetical protein PLICRDRAFT_54159 [Plicaturopsis crispa FD-325 SS-3]|nr:hypothetical protein PLICRDRAFT_54159 [Plicaturopsis crispa FD-325 SS-3]
MTFYGGFYVVVVLGSIFVEEINSVWNAAPHCTDSRKGTARPYLVSLLPTMAHIFVCCGKQCERSETDRQTTLTVISLRSVTCQRIEQFETRPSRVLWHEPIPNQSYSITLRKEKPKAYLVLAYLHAKLNRIRMLRRVHRARRPLRLHEQCVGQRRFTRGATVLEIK